jgi:predicted metalloenzyme YecM
MLSVIRMELPQFHEQQVERCAQLGLEAKDLRLSHVAVRMRTWNEYVAARDSIETACVGNLENVWNGRPISKMLLAEPLPAAFGKTVELIELIAPFHQRVYKMGVEHVGFIVGEGFDEFGRRHRDALTGQQFQSGLNAPYYILFEDYTHVKFYPWGLREVCEREGASFDVFTHADWVPSDPTAGPYELV